MMCRYLSWLAALACAAVLLPGQAVQLADGTLLAGEVQNVTGDGLTLVRIDSGGVLQLRWEHLAADSAQELKRAFNLSVEDDSEVLVEAEVLTYVTPAGGMEEQIGRQVGSDANVVQIRSRGAVVPIPRKSVRTRVTRMVPALSVYTKEEFYREKLVELSPGDDADRQILLADLLVRVDDYERAELHYKRAEELGTSKQPAALRAKLARVSLFKSAAGERALLDQIKASRARKEFGRGRELIADFEKKYAGGKLVVELTAEKQRFEEARERYFIDKVVQAWYQQMNAVAKTKCLDPSFTFAAAGDYVTSAMGKEIRKKIAERLSLQVAEVEAMWGKRLTNKVGAASQTFSYGIGSWMLGEQKIIANTQAEKAASQGKEKSPEQARDERLERKIREFLDRAKQAQKNAGTEAKEDTEEDWWRKAQHDERVNYVKALYAENSGDMEVVLAFVAPCVTCGAEGKLPSLGSTGGKEEFNKCWTCKGTRFKRWLRAR